MTRVDAEAAVVLKGPRFARLAGPGMCLLAIVGLGVIGMTEPVAMLFIGPLWALPLIWWGARTARLGVTANNVLTIRNPIRTYQLDWSEIRDIRFEKRTSSFRRLTLQSNRWIGVVEVAGAAKPIEVYATESSRFAVYGHIFSQNPSTAQAKFERLRSAWIRRDGDRRGPIPLRDDSQ